MQRRKIIVDTTTRALSMWVIRGMLVTWDKSYQRRAATLPPRRRMNIQRPYTTQLQVHKFHYKCLLQKADILDAYE